MCSDISYDQTKYMKNRIRLSEKKAILSAVSLLFSMWVFSQSCPLNAGDYKLNTQTASGANKVKQTEYNGLVDNMLWCPYKAAGQPDISTYVYWVTNVPNNKFIYNWTCIPITSSKDIINVDTKQAYATFGGYNTNDEYRRGLMKTVGEKILQEVVPFAVPCPNKSINNNNKDNSPDNSVICRKNFDALRLLLENRSGINSQLEMLQGNTFNETESRDTLSKFSKYVSLIKNDTPVIRNNVPVYLNANKIPPELNNLYLDRNKSQLAIDYGLNPDAELLEIVRGVRDIIAARIDYFKKAPELIKQYNQDLLKINAEIDSLHKENIQKKCPGDYDINSCDLSGEWIFTRWDIDNDNGPFDETWEFTPVSKGWYSAINRKTGHLGEAEIYGKQVKFIVKLRLDYSITHIFLLNDVCNAGGGNTNLQVTNTRLTVRRNEPGIISYVNDKLYDISFNGKNYQGLYKRQTDNRTPIDVFYFKTLNINGYQIEQDGEKLWGRFVRRPSSDYSDQSNVEWWFVEWIFENNKWVVKEKKMSAPPKIRQ